MPTAELTHEFSRSAEAVWRTVGSFERYEWGAGVTPGIIEEGRPDNEVGSIRAFQYYGAPGRQRLTAHSNADRACSWESLESFADIRHYVQTITVSALEDGRSLMTWSVDFDAPEARSEHWCPFFREEFAKSFEKVEKILALDTR